MNHPLKILRNIPDLNFRYSRIYLPVTNPGFARGRQLIGGAPSYYLTKLLQKLHGNEENWAELGGGGARQNVTM